MVRIKNLRNEKLVFKNDVRVDRFSALGNPFKPKDDSDSERDRVCDLYEEWFNAQLINGSIGFKIALKFLIKIYLKYGKIDLFCWCYPKRCYAETIRRFLENADLQKFIVPTENTLTKESSDYQKLALTHIFNSMPNREALLSSKGIKAYDRQPFNEDSWIFQGTENDMEPIMEDIFGSIDSDLSDYEHNVAIARKCKSAVPLHHGEIGAASIDNKFSGKQHCRQIWENCSYSGGSVRIPQLTQTGACTIPSQYRPENIVKFAKVTFKQAVGLSRIYKYLEFDFKVVIKVNKAVRKRKCKNPWDIKITHDGLTLLELVEDLRGINVRMELEALADPQYEDWCHYDDGFGEVMSRRTVDIKGKGTEIRTSDHTNLYKFKIMDNLASGSHNELEADESNPFEVVSMPNEFTYWNQSMIPTPACLLSKDTNKLFLKLRGIIVDRQITKKNLPKLSKFIRKLTPAQKLEIKKSVGIAYRQTADSFTEGMQDQIGLYA